MTVHGARTSGYKAPMTIQEVASNGLTSLLNAVRSGNVNSETPYGRAVKKATVWTLAGGGPGVELILIGPDDDPEEGYYVYYEPEGVAIEYVRPYEAAEIMEAFTTPPQDS